MTYSLCALLLTFCAAADAQQAVKIARIGILGDAPPAGVEAFRSALHDLKWIEGRNVTIAYRPHDGKRDLLFALAAEFVNQKVDLILAPGTVMALTAQKATNSIPIVLAGAADPVAAGLVASLARPGGNITGLSNVEVELNGKRLELLKETLPKLGRVAALWRPGGPGNEQQMKEIESAARLLRLQLLQVGALEAKDFESAFSGMKKDRAEALITVSAPFFANHRTTIVELAASTRLPAIYSQTEFVDAGGLMSYGLNSAYPYRRAAVYVDKILKGAKSAELPIEQPTKFDLVINLNAAKQIGLTIPPNVLARADRVIR
jgi:putative ABC transport system substrate-binding protein